MTSTIDDSGVRAKLDNISKRGQNITPALRRIGMLLVGQIKLNIRSQGLIDQGALLNSIDYKLINQHSLEVGSYGAPYAVTHEYGTIGKGGELRDIVPIRAKHLTIPFKDYKNIRARDIFDNLFYMRYKNNAYLRDKVNNRMAYLLVDKVAIPPRPFIRPAFEKHQNNIVQIIREELAVNQ